MWINAARIMTLCVVASCGGAGSVKIDEEALPSVVEFVTEAARRDVGLNLRGLSVAFVAFPPDSELAGLCTTPGKRITINKDYWLVANPFERRLLIFHELGHCLLGREHVEGSYSHVMNPSLFSGVSDDKWRTMLDVFFGKAAPRE